MRNYLFLVFAVLLFSFLIFASLTSSANAQEGVCPHSNEQCMAACGNVAKAQGATVISATTQVNMVPQANAAGSCPSGWGSTNDTCYCVTSGGNSCIPILFVSAQQPKKVAIDCSNIPCCIPPTPTPEPTCHSSTGGHCSDTYISNNLRFNCASGEIPDGNSYECNFLCCRDITCNDIPGGDCGPRNHRACVGGDVDSYAGVNPQNQCEDLNNAFCCLPEQSCNGGATTDNVCRSNGRAFNTCGDTAGKVTHTNKTYVHSNCGVPNTSGGGYTCSPSTDCNQNNFTTVCTTFDDECNGGAGYTCHNQNTCVTNIFVHVYTDYNHNGAKNGNDDGKQNVTVSDGGGNNVPSDGNGNVTFGLKGVGNYTITETVPANFKAVNAASQGVTLDNNNGNKTVNFYLTPLYSISGQVFKDVNKNQQNDGSDTGYGGGTIHISGGPTAVVDMTAAGNGTWATPTNLQAGTYLVTYTTSLATGFTFTTPSSFSVTVGDPAGAPACATGGSLDATCGGINNGSVANLDIGLTDENPWKQSVCLDVRDDSGAYQDLIPAAPSCGGLSGSYNSITNADCSTGAGIIFTCDATPDFGLGSSNANGWQAGGATTDAECYSGPGLNVVRTSYDYLTTTMREAAITPVDMSTVCTLSSCTLPAELTKGLYAAEGDVHLNAATFPVDPSTPQGFIFLIHGDLYIDGNIIVPAGSVAAFSTSGNIFVNKEVGNVVTDPNDVSNNTPNIEGLYSADANFIIESKGDGGTNICNADGTPLDKKLNIVGSVITNAANAGGSLQNNRDMCLYDLQCSSLSLGDGTGADNGLAMSYLLTLFADGKFLSHKVFNWQELRP